MGHQLPIKYVHVVFFWSYLDLYREGSRGKVSQQNKGNFFKNNLVLYSVLFHFDHICRQDQCGGYILHFKISTDPDLIIHELGLKDKGN